MGWKCAVTPPSRPLGQIVTLVTFLTSKKIAPFLTRVEKNFFKIGRTGYQKKRNFALISKMYRTLASRSSQRFFLRKTLVCKISKSLKNQFICKNFFSFCQTRELCTFLKSVSNSTSFDTLFAQFWRIFFNSYKGQCYFFRRIKGQIR